MKGKLFLSAIIGILIGALAAIVYIQYQSNQAPGDSSTEAVEISTIESYMNPEFSDVQSFMSYVSDLTVEKQTDSILTHTSVPILTEIASVCLRKYGSIDRTTLRKEYNANYDDVYKYLNQNKQSTAIVDPTSPPDNSQGGNQATTTRDTTASIAIVTEGKTTVQLL